MVEKKKKLKSGNIFSQSKHVLSLYFNKLLDMFAPSAGIYVCMCGQGTYINVDRTIKKHQ